MVATALSTMNGSSTGCTSRRILPDTIRETSSTSSTICVSHVAFRSSVSRPRAAFSADSMPPRSSREYPTMALSGVRSSCDSTARNSSFIRFAACASAYSRAFSSATDAHAATPSASRSCCSVNTPVSEWPKNNPPSTSPADAFHRHRQVAADRQVPRRHPVIRGVLSVTRILRHVVQPHRPLAVERRRKHGGRARIAENPRTLRAEHPTACTACRRRPIRDPSTL